MFLLKISINRKTSTALAVGVFWCASAHPPAAERVARRHRKSWELAVPEGSKVPPCAALFSAHGRSDGIKSDERGGGVEV